MLSTRCTTAAILQEARISQFFGAALARIALPKKPHFSSTKYTVIDFYEGSESSEIEDWNHSNIPFPLQLENMV